MAPDRRISIPWEDVGYYRDMGSLGVITVGSRDGNATIRAFNGISGYPELCRLIRTKLIEHGRIAIR